MGWKLNSVSTSVCLYVCVYVCDYERERERERDSQLFGLASSTPPLSRKVSLQLHLRLRNCHRKGSLTGHYTSSLHRDRRIDAEPSVTGMYIYDVVGFSSAFVCDVLSCTFAFYFFVCLFSGGGECGCNELDVGSGNRGVGVWGWLFTFALFSFSSLAF
jgi:hypothetical protein